MLGFGEGEGREIEKRREWQGSAFWRKKKAGFVFIGFWKRFFFAFIFIFIFLVLEKLKKKKCANVENCGSFRRFGYVYISYRPVRCTVL